RPGFSGATILGDPDRYWNIDAFALPAVNHRGNLGRNSLIGPGMTAVDLSLNRSFRIAERTALQFRTEVFNLRNHPNLATHSGRTTVTSAAGAVAPDWGRITAGTSTSRQIQFALKVEFLRAGDNSGFRSGLQQRYWQRSWPRFRRPAPRRPGSIRSK